MLDINKIFRQKIEQLILTGKKNFVLYPFAKEGMEAKRILNERYGIQESFIMDNRLAKVNPAVKDVEYLKTIDVTHYTFLITDNRLEIYDELREELREIVPKENIEELFPLVNMENDPRVETLRLMAEVINERHLEGAVAEVGVYKGKFARYINRFFKERTLYLFDTFEGFAHEELKKTTDLRWQKTMQIFNCDLLKDTSIETVLSNMKYPEKIVIRKGYFPKTAEDIEDIFCFVSLDVDIYQSTKDGLEYFWPRMVPGGVIMLHDYNCSNCIGVKKAVDEFAADNHVGFVCLTDECGSVVLTK